MRKPYETSADRIWKEKLNSCISPFEAIVLAIVIAALALGMFIAP